MSNFIYDDTGLNGPKNDLAVIPSGANANQWVAAADWNQIRQALLDIQTVMSGNQLVIASPAGADNWIKLLSGVTDTPTAVGVIIDTVSGTFSTSGTPLLSVRKGGVEQFKVDRFGIVTGLAFQTSGLGAFSGGSLVIRQNPGDAAFTITPNGGGEFLFTTNNGNSFTNSGLIRWRSGQADGANTYFAFDTENAIVNSSARLFALRNTGVTLCYFDKQGSLFWPGSGCFIKTQGSGPAAGFVAVSGLSDDSNGQGLFFGSNAPHTGAGGGFGLYAYSGTSTALDAAAIHSQWFSDVRTTSILKLLGNGDLTTTGNIAMGTGKGVSWPLSSTGVSDGTGLASGFVVVTPGLASSGSNGILNLYVGPAGGPSGFGAFTYASANTLTSAATHSIWYKDGGTNSILELLGDGSLTATGNITTAGDVFTGSTGTGTVHANILQATGTFLGLIGAASATGPEQIITTTTNTVTAGRLFHIKNRNTPTFQVLFDGTIATNNGNINCSLGNVAGVTLTSRLPGAGTGGPSLTVNNSSGTLGALDKILSLKNGSSEVQYIDGNGTNHLLDYATATGATNCTCDASTGRITWTGAGGNTMQVSCNRLGAGCIIQVQVESLGTGPNYVKGVSNGGSNFTVTFDANQTAGSTVFTYVITRTS